MTTSTTTTTTNKMTTTSNTIDTKSRSLYEADPTTAVYFNNGYTEIAYSKLLKTIETPLYNSRSFKKIRILSENKVVEVTFADGQKVKTICDDESEFSLEFALYLSLAKRLYSDKYTSEGVWKKAQDLKYEKYFVKLVHDGLKMYKKEQKEKEQTFDWNSHGIGERELEITALVAEGLSNKEISEKVCLSEGTVRNYISNVLEKLELRDRTQLAVYYLQRGRKCDKNK